MAVQNWKTEVCSGRIPTYCMFHWAWLMWQQHFRLPWAFEQVDGILPGLGLVDQASGCCWKRQARGEVCSGIENSFVQRLSARDVSKDADGAAVPDRPPPHCALAKCRHDIAVLNDRMAPFCCNKRAWCHL
ncbi:unnamed protein product [Ostreobium quekettii]|uniref:Uncharacterized protein n=1 Tax=Ostreobium quekettii TaxID=121088 RepID=A0A8S1J6H8_9CHLO|nr:unnamed protein product [Ostreobium quekettii]